MMSFVSLSTFVFFFFFRLGRGVAPPRRRCVIPPAEGVKGEGKAFGGLRAEGMSCEYEILTELDEIFKDLLCDVIAFLVVGSMGYVCRMETHCARPSSLRGRPWW